MAYPGKRKNKLVTRVNKKVKDENSGNISLTGIRKMCNARDIKTLNGMNDVLSLQNIIKNKCLHLISVIFLLFY